VTRNQPHGTAFGAALTDGYTTGFLIAGAIYLVALVVAALTIRMRANEAELH